MSPLGETLSGDFPEVTTVLSLLGSFSLATFSSELSGEWEGKSPAQSWSAAAEPLAGPVVSAKAAAC